MGLYLWSRRRHQLQETQMNISSSSTKAEIIQGAQEYLATTDEQLKTLKGDRQALVVLLAVTATFALLF
jgi:hypothetical protein